MKRFLYLLTLAVTSVTFAADSAYDVILTQRKDDNSGNIQRNVTSTPSTAIGFDSAGHPTTIPVSSVTGTGNALLSGGNVDRVGGLVLTVGATSWRIQGQQFNTTTLTTLTAAAADVTNPRIDIVALDNTGTPIIIQGTPAANPIAPDVDPSSQLYLTFYTVAAGATEISASKVDIYHEGVEWTMSRSGTTFNLTSTNNPYVGTTDIEGTSVTGTNSWTAAGPSNINLANYDTLFLYIRVKAAWPSTRQFSVQWLNNSNVAQGSIVTVKNGTFGLNALTNFTTYQQVAIPLSSFGANGLAVRKLKFTMAGTGAAVGLYVDEVTLQGGLAPVIDNSRLRWRGSYTTPSSVLYAVNDLVLAEDGRLYVCSTANTGNTPSLTSTFWTVAGTYTTTGVNTAAGSWINSITPISLAANAGVIDITKGVSAASNNANTTYTFSGSRTAGEAWGLIHTNTDTSNRTITIPSTFDLSTNTTRTTYTSLAGATDEIFWRNDGSRDTAYLPTAGYSPEQTFASATTVDIASSASVNIAISGTTSITGFTSAAAGIFRQGRFTGALTFTHSSALLLPNAGSNITTAANDRFGAYSLGSGNWLVLWYQRADGTALAGSGGSPGGSSGDYQYNNGGAFGGRTPGTGVNTAFQLPTNATGGLLTFSGAFGTPTSLTLTNATGLPIGGVTGLGTGVATWLATPSSANLLTALTDETGTGVAVFGTAPTFTTQATIPKIVYTGSVIEVTGTGSPEGAITAAVGSVYHRTDGGSATTLYIKESGSGNTGWTAVAVGGTGTITSSTSGQVPVYTAATTIAGTSALTFASGSLAVTNSTAGSVATVSGLNDTSNNVNMSVYGSTNATTAYRNNGLISTSKSLLFLTDNNTSTGGASTFQFFTGGYSSGVTFTIGAGNPGAVTSAGSFTGLAGITSSNSNSVSSASVTTTNDNSNNAGIVTYGSTFGITGFRNHGVLSASDGIIFLPDNANSSGGSKNIQFITGGYSNSSSFTVAAGNPGTTTAVGALVASTSLTVGTGMPQSAGGVKHHRDSTGSISAGSSSVVTVTWNGAFADSNYTPNVSVLDSTASTLGLRVVHIESVSASAITVRVENTSVGSLTGTLFSTAIHD